MAIADPKTYAKTAVEDKSDENAELRSQLATLASQVATLTSAQAQSGGITAAQLKEVLSELVKVQASAQEEALRRIAERDQQDDINYPRISVYSYPEGDRARPRAPFKCRIFWCGYDMDWDTTTAAEIELLNALEPGEYTFRRIGGGVEKVTVTGERNANGVLSKLDITFATKEQRDTLPSMLSMLRDILRVKSAEEVEIERLKAEVARLRAVEHAA